MIEELETLAPLHSFESEQMVIGGVLINNTAIDEAVSMKEQDFFLPTHRKAWRAMQALSGQGKEISVVSVEAWLEERGDTENGLLGYLAGCQMNTPSAANIAHYVSIVKDRAVQRSLAAALEMAAIDLRKPGLTVAQRIDQVTQLVNDAAEQRETMEPKSLAEVLHDCLGEFMRRHDADGEITGLPTGFVDLDRMTGGLKGGNLVIVAGRPSMGKSTFAFNIAENVTRAGKAVLAFTLEMSSREQGFRTIASLASIPMDDLNAGKFSDEEDWNRLTNFVQTSPDYRFHLDERTDITIAELRATARRLKRRRGLDLILVDYIGLMVQDNSNAVAEISNITRGLKLLAKELDIPIIALAQLNRKVEERADKRPLMSDLRDSGSIEQDADIVLMIYRDDYYDKHSPGKGYGECLIRKQRNGPTGEIAMLFEGHFARYRNAVQHEYFSAFQRAKEDKTSNRRKGGFEL